MWINCNFVTMVGLTNDERCLIRNLRAEKHRCSERFVKMFSNRPKWAHLILWMINSKCQNCPNCINIWCFAVDSWKGCHLVGGPGVTIWAWFPGSEFVSETWNPQEFQILTTLAVYVCTVQWKPGFRHMGTYPQNPPPETQPELSNFSFQFRSIMKYSTSVKFSNL